jgi:hypothetical protein
VASIPDQATLALTGEALPSAQYSSDHVLLCADIQLGLGVGPAPGVGVGGGAGPQVGGCRALSAFVGDWSYPAPTGDSLRWYTGVVTFPTGRRGTDSMGWLE